MLPIYSSDSSLNPTSSHCINDILDFFSFFYQVQLTHPYGIDIEPMTYPPPLIEEGDGI